MTNPLITQIKEQKVQRIVANLEDLAKAHNSAPNEEARKDYLPFIEGYLRRYKELTGTDYKISLIGDTRSEEK